MHEQAEGRKRLLFLLAWLEQIITAGDTQAAVHTALGKIYILQGRGRFP